VYKRQSGINTVGTATAAVDRSAAPTQQPIPAPTQQPIPAPTPVPVPSPTASPVAAPVAGDGNTVDEDTGKKKGGGNANSAASNGLILIMVASGLVFLVLLAGACKVRQYYKDNELSSWMNNAMDESDNDGLGGGDGIQMKPKRKTSATGGNVDSIYMTQFENPTASGGGALQPFGNGKGMRPAAVQHVMSVQDLELQLADGNDTEL
jgi:hypothetical protein